MKKFILILIIIFNFNSLLSQNWIQNQEIGSDTYVHSIFYPNNSENNVIVIADSIPIDRSEKNMFPSYFSLLDGYGYFVSEDGGKTFPNQRFMDNKIILSISESNNDEDKWICSAIEKNISTIGISTDKGENWDFETSQCKTSSKIINFVNLPDRMIGGAVSTGFGLIEGGDDFSDCARNDTFNVSIRDIKYFNNKLYIASDDNAKPGAYYSNDLGSTWRKDTQGLSGLRINTISPSPEYEAFNFIVCGADKLVGDMYEGAGIYISTDNGNTWKLQGADGARVYDIKYHPMYPLLMIAACGEDGVYISKNGGLVWEQYNDGLPDGADVRFVSIPNREKNENGYDVYLGVFAEGLWHSTGLDFELTSVEQAKDFDIVTVGPNPFVNQFDIYLSSNKNEEVSISIVDLKGEALFEMDKYISAGTNLININNLNFPKGIYFLTIKTSEGIINHKLIKK